MTDQRSKIETITPEQAQHYLTRNYEGNRRLDMKHVGYLERQIRGGHWELTGDPVRFSDSDRLIDGQHRLMACMRAGIPIKTWVLRGLPEETFSKIDRGKARNNGAALQLTGVKNAHLVASVARYVWAWETKGTVPKHLEKLSADEVSVVLDCYPEIVELTAAVKKARTGRAGINDSAMTFVMWLIQKIDRAKALSFLERLGDGVAPRKRFPTLVVRDRFQKLRADRVAIKPAVAVSMLIRGWNAFFNDKDLAVMRVRIEGEDVEIPQVAGASKSRRRKTRLQNKLLPGGEDSVEP